MKSINLLLIGGSVLTVLVAVPMAAAQWPGSEGLSIADRPGEQINAKIRATADGGCYISWLDSAAGGYDVYLQRLDAGGYEMWAHNGILIADRSYSWVQDYGLDVDTAGNALLAFRDDRFGGSARVTVVKVAPDGSMPWGANGVQVSGAAIDATSPAIAATTDGGAIVSWGAEPGIQLQKLSAAGAPQWLGGVTITPPSGHFFNADLRTADDGGAILSIVRQGPEYWSARELWAQKFSASGTTLWGTDPVIVFNDGSLQYGYQPDFIPDGSGGGVFMWYETSPLQCYAQHVLADGTEQFGDNGAEVSTASSRGRVNPCVAFKPDTAETFVFWLEVNAATQSHIGVYGQKLDEGGGRQWTVQGIEIYPCTTEDIGSMATLQCGEGALAFWMGSQGYAQERLYAARLDTNGDFVWEPSILTISDVPSEKWRLVADSGPDGRALLAWTDDRSGNRDIYAQMVCPDGTIGECGVTTGDVNCDGLINAFDIDPFVLALTDAAAYEAAYPDCDISRADINGDGLINAFDIDPFVQLLIGR
jgi:hypothetical protein